MVQYVAETMSDKPEPEDLPRIGDVYTDRSKANLQWPFGRVHVTDVQTIRDVVTVWIEYAGNAQQTRSKLKLWEFQQRYFLAFRPNAKPATPPPDAPGLENVDGMERLGGMDPAAALVAATKQAPREHAIFDGPGYEPVSKEEGARLKAERDARRGKPADKPAAVIIPDVAEKDLPF